MRKLICLVIVAFSLFTSSAFTSFGIFDTDRKELTHQWVNCTDKITMEQEDEVQAAIAIAMLNGTMELKTGPNEYLLIGNILKNRRFMIKVSKEDWDYFKTWILQ
jgi:hypothetical protein